MLSTLAFLGLAVPATAELHAHLTAGSHFVDFGVNGDFEVEYRVTNVGTTEERFLPWYTPLDSIWEDIFDIKDRSGNKVPYAGKVARRVPVEDSHYTVMQPGEALTAKFELSDAYQLPSDGTYFITMAHFNQTRGAPVYAAVNEVSMQFSRVTVQLERVLERRDALKANNLQVSYDSSCSTSQRNEAVQGYQEGLKHIARANTCLTPTSVNSQVSSTYLTWFESTAYIGGTWGTDSCYAKTASIINNYNVKCCPADCGASCGPSMYGYVYPSDTTAHWVHLCGAYFGNTVLEKARTITHELAHFYDTCWAYDIVYGESGCKALPASQAYENADNICYFASYLPANACGSPY
jgi:hypothetical protein